MIEKRAAELARELDAERTHSHTSSSNLPLHHQLSQQRGGGGGGGGGTGGATASNSGGRGNISVQFFEKKRRKGWFVRAYGGNDEEVCWECWTIKVTVAEPRTESGKGFSSSSFYPYLLFFANLIWVTTCQKMSTIVKLTNTLASQNAPKSVKPWSRPS